jgi:hypothetical protein
MRPPISRIIAAVIAAGGTPFALLLTVVAFEAPMTLLTLSPGWFAYFALIWAAIGRRQPGDPFTTWLPCIFVNSFWAWGWSANFKFAPGDSPLRYYLHLYVWAAVLGGVAGLILDLIERWKKTPQYWKGNGDVTD